jgi:hypothetical protein
LGSRVFGYSFLGEDSDIDRVQSNCCTSVKITITPPKLMMLLKANADALARLGTPFDSSVADSEIL